MTNNQKIFGTQKVTTNANEKREGYRNPFPATDFIVEYDMGQGAGVKIPLIERLNFPYGLAIPGGFHERGISGLENACKEASEEINLEIIITDPDRPFLYMTDPNRDPRGHVISAVYLATGTGVLRAGDDAAAVSLYSPQEIKGLFGQDKFAFDHEKILTRYLSERWGI
ncbi:NUDIX hydrolase [archaeon]|nr:NUDIX hydrolase [archaeon]MBT6762038.1 NUDIX hydrolase [archaeon]